MIDVKDFEQILRTVTGDELEPDEVKMVGQIMKNLKIFDEISSDFEWKWFSWRWERKGGTICSVQISDEICGESGSGRKQIEKDITKCSYNFKIENHLKKQKVIKIKET